MCERNFAAFVDCRFELSLTSLNPSIFIFALRSKALKSFFLFFTRFSLTEKTLETDLARLKSHVKLKRCLFSQSKRGGKAFERVEFVSCSESFRWEKKLNSLAWIGEETTATWWLHKSEPTATANTSLWYQLRSWTCATFSLTSEIDALKSVSEWFRISNTFHCSKYVNRFLRVLIAPKRRN